MIESTSVKLLRLIASDNSDAIKPGSMVSDTWDKKSCGLVISIEGDVAVVMWSNQPMATSPPPNWSNAAPLNQARWTAEQAQDLLNAGYIKSYSLEQNEGDAPHITLEHFSEEKQFASVTAGKLWIW